MTRAGRGGGVAIRHINEHVSWSNKKSLELRLIWFHKIMLLLLPY